MNSIDSNVVFRFFKFNTTVIKRNLEIVNSIKLRAIKSFIKNKESGKVVYYR